MVIKIPLIFFFENKGHKNKDFVLREKKPLQINEEK